MRINKRNVIFFLSVLLFYIHISLPVLAQEPAIQAKAAVLMDLETGQVLWEKNGAMEMPPASTTKVLTGILAYDMGDLDKICTISPKAAAVGEASLHLRAGEKLSLYELLNGALICSGNDACVAIAESVSGTEGLFVHWMNIKGQILGAKNSNFINTNGLPAPNHLVSAYDLALISRYAMHRQEFSSVVKKRFEVIGEGASKRYLKNTNKLLWNYAFCIGVKTGTTDAAGPCLVSAAEKEGNKYLSVVLNSPDRYGDSYRLLEYGLNHFSHTTVYRKGDLVGSVKVNHGTKPNVGAEIALDETIVQSISDSSALRKRYYLQEEIAAPIREGQSLGHIAFYDNKNHLISTINVTAMEDIPEKIHWWQELIKWPSGIKRNFEKLAFF